MIQPANCTGSTEGPFCGYTPLSACERTGRNEAAPTPCAQVMMMDASPTSQSDGESVSDAQDFEQRLVEEVSETRYLLRRTVTQDAEPQEIELCVKEARARLEHLEQVVEQTVE